MDCEADSRQRLPQAPEFVGLSPLEDTRVHGDHNHQASDDQRSGNEGDKKDTSSACWEFAADNPIL